MTRKKDSASISASARGSVIEQGDAEKDRLTYTDRLIKIRFPFIGDDLRRSISSDRTDNNLWFLFGMGKEELHKTIKDINKHEPHETAENTAIVEKIIRSRTAGISFSVLRRGFDVFLDPSDFKFALIAIFGVIIGLASTNVSDNIPINVHLLYIFAAIIISMTYFYMVYIDDGDHRYTIAGKLADFVMLSVVPFVIVYQISKELICLYITCNETSSTNNLYISIGTMILGAMMYHSMFYRYKNYIASVRSATDWMLLITMMSSVVYIIFSTAMMFVVVAESSRLPVIVFAHGILIAISVVALVTTQRSPFRRGGIVRRDQRILVILIIALYATVLVDSIRHRGALWYLTWTCMASTSIACVILTANRRRRVAPGKRHIHSVAVISFLCVGSSLLALMGQGPVTIIFHPNNIGGVLGQLSVLAQLIGIPTFFQIARTVFISDRENAEMPGKQELEDACNEVIRWSDYKYEGFWFISNLCFDWMDPKMGLGYLESALSRNWSHYDRAALLYQKAAGLVLDGKNDEALENLQEAIALYPRMKKLATRDELLSGLIAQFSL